MFALADDEMIVAILSLVDSALVAVLLLIIGFSGYENFVSKTGRGEHEDRPAWMGQVGFSDLKIKLVGAIVAISAVELSKAVIDIEKLTWQELARKGRHPHHVRRVWRAICSGGSDPREQRHSLSLRNPADPESWSASHTSRTLRCKVLTLEWFGAIRNFG